ncbi:MAG: MFS transporter, partial [Gammaproteobacteria bacterium]
EGPAFPAFTRVVTDWLPISQRARALAAGLAAVPFASVIGAPLISSLIIVFNWRIMFFALGTAGVIWAFLWYYFFSDVPEKNRHLSQDELLLYRTPLDNSITQTTHTKSEIKKTTWKFMFFNPSLLVNNYAFFSFGYLLFFAMTWLPGYFEQVYHLQLHKIALFLIMPWLLGTILILIGGILSDLIWKKTGSIRLSRSHMIWICQVVSPLCFIPVVTIHSLSVAIIFISLAVGIGLMPNAAFYAINADLARDRAATSLGIMDCGFALAGILAPAITGLLSHLLGGFSAAIGLLMILTLSSALAVFIWQQPDEN